MIDQIIIGDKASFDDFGASVAKRARKKPKKKSIKETVPFSNITHDFSAINGEIYWEDAQHEYVFEMVAPTAERLEEMKTAFENWVMNIIKQELHDPLVPDYHYIVTYEDMSYDDDDSMEKTTATVAFSAYPYKIANHETSLEFKFHLNRTLFIQNNSSHRVTAKLTATGGAIGVNPLLPSMEGHPNYPYGFVLEDGQTYEGEWVMLESGLNRFECESIEGIVTVTLTVTFREEVF